MVKELLRRIKEDYSLLDENIYVGDRKKKNMQVMCIICILLAVATSITTIMNIYDGNMIMAMSTGMIYLLSIIGAVFSTSYKFKRVSSFTFGLALIITFTYYTISGNNDGFAVLWTMLIPPTMMYVINVKIGLIISLYFEILFMALFYSPLSSHYVTVYGRIFVERYPLLYGIDTLIALVMMTQYHISCVHVIQTEEKLKNRILESRNDLYNAELELEKASRQIDRAENKELITVNDIPDDYVVINKASGLSDCLGDEEFYNELLQTFYDQGLSYLLQIKDYVEDEDWERYKVLVHSIKNTSRTIGALTFSELSKTHEYAVRDNDINYIKEHYLFYLAAYGKLLANIRKELAD